MDQPLSQKTALITGASSGIGRAVALALASGGANLVLVARDRARGEGVLAEARRLAPNSTAELLLCDLSSQAQIRQMVAAFLKRHSALHLLINNAGALIGSRCLTDDGIEATFATNHVGPFLLTRLLLTTLAFSAPAQVINVASAAARNGDLPFDDLNMDKGYSQLRAYGRSKLANILFTRELARRLAGTGVTTVAVHPGVVRTGFGSSGKGLVRLGFKLLAPFLLAPEQGADTIVWAATAPEAKQLNGAYLVRRRVVNPVPLARDDEAARRLWELSATLTHLDPGIGLPNAGSR